MSTGHGADNKKHRKKKQKNKCEKFVNFKNPIDKKEFL
jgi:hypothetical protein